MTLAIERASARHSTARNQTNVQLMDCLRRRITKARLLNISHHGALILTDDVAVLHEPLNVRLENEPGAGWIAAETVRFGRSKEVGIRFYRPCPRGFFLVATLRESIPRVTDDEKEPPFMDEKRSEYSAPCE